MTIATTINRVSYAGNGSTTVFSFPYYFLQNADLVVVKRNNTTGVETTQTITTNYTITGAGLPAGGSVTMLSAPASGETLIIYRDPAKVQDLDLVENDPMPAEEIEERFDKLTMIVQRLQDQLDRSIRLTDGYSGTFSNLRLPSLIEALKVLRINSGATAFELVDSSTADFDGISPLTTKGDLLTFYSGTNQRVGVGSDGQVLLADSSQTAGIRWGSSGGGGGSLAWEESENAPLPAIENNIRIYSFATGLAQSLYAVIKVPSTYTAGNPIKLKTYVYSNDTSGDVHMKTVATLIRVATDPVSSTTNQRTSTNAAITLSGATQDEAQLLDFDLSSATGQINSVAVSANDLILVRLFRDTDTATGDSKMPVYGAEVTFA